MSDTRAVVSQIVPPPQPELDFAVGVLEQDGAAVIAFSGEMDLAASTDMSAAIEHALTLGLPVLVDLCDVSFMDSTGLSLVLRARALAEMRGLSFAVSCTPAGVAERLFGIVGLAETLSLHGSRSAARSALRTAA